MNAPRTGPHPLAAGPGAISDGDFALLARIVREDSGINLTPGKKGLVVSRLAKRLRHLSLPDIAAYCQYLQSAAGADERAQLVSCLTTNVTSFFREAHHFRALRDEVLPGLLATARSGGRVRLWSAGCSTGQEPYSLAMTILEAMPDAARHDIRILATDIDPQVVEKARAGIYPEAELAQLGPERLRRWVRTAEGARDQGRITEAPRALISFSTLNLIGPWPMRGRFDVIFCRNVVIYFDAETQAGLWHRYARLLPEGGELFIGHSERVSRDMQPYFSNAGITRYRRNAKPLPAPPPGPAHTAKERKQ
ncbi:MAG: protein-glutamate O-methyltransferase [Pararhodobacter sp.]|nr:protein-glutamate O-methyltransferase [Pararhodobacter sp.]